MSIYFEDLSRLIYSILLLVLIWLSIRLTYRRPRFVLSVYSRSRLLFLILGILVFCTVFYSLLTRLVLNILSLDVVNGALSAVIILPAGYESARRLKLPRLIWLKRRYHRRQILSLPHFCRASIAGGFCCLLYTVALFKLFKTEINPSFLKELERSGLTQPGAEFIQVASIIAAPVYEEIIFRFTLISVLWKWLRKIRALQDAAKGFSLVLAILISTMLWTFLHSGMLIPFGVKEAQIFGIGILLSLLFWRFGLESSIIAHTILNINTLLFFQVFA